jgi:hypothetical protein
VSPPFREYDGLLHQNSVVGPVAPTARHGWQYPLQQSVDFGAVPVVPPVHHTLDLGLRVAIPEILEYDLWTMKPAQSQYYSAW